MMDSSDEENKVDQVLPNTKQLHSQSETDRVIDELNQVLESVGDGSDDFGQFDAPNNDALIDTNSAGEPD